MSGPADRIEALRERNPGAAELALAVSLAVRVEPDLLRHARLLVGADATAEADLWWSDLVASQNSDGIMLAPDVAEELRARLAAPERHRLREDAWALVGSQHAGEHLAVRLEELVNWLSIAGGAEAEDRIEELLVAGAHEWMASSDVPGGGARWMLNALRRLPRRAAESPGRERPSASRRPPTRRASRRRSPRPRASSRPTRWTTGSRGCSHGSRPRRSPSRSPTAGSSSRATVSTRSRFPCPAPTR